MKKVRVSRDDAALIYALGAAALCLSYSALADIAARAGLGDWQAAVWPLVVDGLIIAATRAAVTLDAGPARRYAWFLLWAAVGVSIAGNVAHLLLPPGPAHPGVAATVAVVPPVAALALTHLAIVRARALAGTSTGGDKHRPENIITEPIDAPDDHDSPRRGTDHDEAPRPVTRLRVAPATPPRPAATPPVATPRATTQQTLALDIAPVTTDDELRARAIHLVDTEGLSMRATGAQLGISKDKVHRWVTAHRTSVAAATVAV
ncbi:DUF2637 domain-containing protein [Rhodococcus sp. CX]|uniref:DUF2637 domain-containing protein n=1 Tax=Rhodococcus sp. CX TaxID=2789880 RepID=UPI0018CE82F6|nr:DUF2637 domain-containing protein [Rhodococcus sp. CX]MBH0118994.1 DUF2637 domain-containing protein [Rhodococcus sp. CX]